MSRLLITWGLFGLGPLIDFHQSGRFFLEKSEGLRVSRFRISNEKSHGSGEVESGLDGLRRWN